MIKNYFRIAWRNLLKRKSYALINIFGLALGAAICLLIVLFIKSEKNVDSWRKDADNVYRMGLIRKYPGRESSYAIIPQSYAKTIKEELPEVEEVVRVFNFFNNGTFQIKYGDKKFEETEVYFADPTFFEIFKSNHLFGNETDPLGRPNTIVLNETTAKKYFGDASKAVGKIIEPEGNNFQPLEVTAVYEDWPDNSHFTFNALISTSENNNFEQENYVGFSAYTYLRLNDNASPEKVEAAMPGIIRKFAAGDIQRQFSMPIEKFMESGNGYVYFLQPLKDIYLKSNLENEFRANGNSTTLYIFGLVAIFILFIACVNFINLSTARSSERAKEVGIRKTFGSERKTLITQFMAESFLISLLAMVVAVAIFALLIPIFNDISGKDFSVSSLLAADAILLLITFTCITGLLAGIYPAFVLSSFNPIQVLRGKFKSGKQGRALRSGLVIFQFSISVILIICTLIVNRQMDFMTSERLGFNKEQTIILERTDLLGENTRAFKNELRNIKGVSSVSGSTALPGQQNFFGVSWATVDNSNETMTGRGLIVDEEYSETLGLELVAGRFFSKEMATDSLAVVINERAARELGLQNPIGRRLVTPEGFLNPAGASFVYTVIGVVKDFHYQSLHEPITPLVFTNGSRFNNVFGLTAVHIEGSSFDQVIGKLEQVWAKFIDDKPLTFQFLDQTIESQYQGERTARKVFTFFSVITIFIACIGLLGLAAYTTRQRIHEIGVRKVLGASVGNIVGMLSKDFIKLVLLSTLIAIPIAWYAMHKWLQNFTYRIDSSWDLFMVAAIIAIITAFATISFQAIKAALANPVKSLRTE
ncbi:putative ABC transport system permease protein [Flavobacteriaceae bacterium MAR_2010_188]|nr:putative ABC transport system permease protein [Flavobacteriaceae bacterium MAR_2010_188]